MKKIDLIILSLFALLSCENKTGKPVKTDSVSNKRGIEEEKSVQKPMIFLMGNPQSDNIQNFEAVTSNKKLDDIILSEPVKEELRRILDVIKSPIKYKERNVRAPKGILLSGPPGIGKTLIGNAMAGEANAYFIYINAAEFSKELMGQGPKMIRNLFAEARKHSPCIIFLDEIDAIGRKRSLEVRGGADRESQAMLNQLLTEIDGFSKDNDGTIIIGATNMNLEVLDPALLRSGRLETKITLPLPTKAEIRKLVALYMHGKQFADGVTEDTIYDIISIARLTGADVSSILNDANSAAVFKGRKIEQQDIIEAFVKCFQGVKSNTIPDSQDKLETAYHELGHAMVSYDIYIKSSISSKEIRPALISIIPRGNSLGFNLITSDIDKINHTKSDFYNKIKILLGGRSAEKVTLTGPTAGCESDLKKAFDIARKMILLGLADKELTGNSETFVACDTDYDKLSSEDKTKVDNIVKIIIDKAEKENEVYLAANLAILKKIANSLATSETGYLIYKDFELNMQAVSI